MQITRVSINVYTHWYIFNGWRNMLSFLLSSSVSDLSRWVKTLWWQGKWACYIIMLQCWLVQLCCSLSSIHSKPTATFYSYTVSFKVSLSLCRCLTTSMDNKIKVDEMWKITVDSWFETSYCKFVMYILLFRDILKIYTTGTYYWCKTRTYL